MGARVIVSVRLTQSHQLPGHNKVTSESLVPKRMTSRLCVAE